MLKLSRMKFIKALDIKSVRLIVAVASIFISFIFIGFDDLLNRDGFLYLFGADEYIAGGFSAAMEVYNWPFISVAIGAVSQISGLSVTFVAPLLMTLVITWVIDSLVRIVHLHQPDVRLAGFVGFCLLCTPFLNEYRADLIRDPFAWAFVFYGVLSSLKFVKERATKDAFLAQVSLLCAVLFRVEAIVFLVLPILMELLYGSSVNRWGNFIRSNFVFIIGAVLCGVGLAVLSGGLFGQLKLTSQIAQYLSADYVFGNVVRHTEFLKNNFLPDWSEDHVVPFLLFGLAAVFVAKVISGLNVLYAVLLGYGWLFNRKRMDCDFKVLVVVSMLSLIPISGFMLNQLFISTRYAGVIILVLTVMTAVLIAPVVVENIKSKASLFLLVLLSLLLIKEVAGIDQDKANYVTAGGWVKENIDKQARLLVTDSRMQYLAGRGYSGGNSSKNVAAKDLSSEILLREYDYALITTKDVVGEGVVKSVDHEKIKSFSGGKYTVQLYKLGD